MLAVKEGTFQTEVDRSFPQHDVRTIPSCLIIGQPVITASISSQGAE
jgi:hypothetical protein